MTYTHSTLLVTLLILGGCASNTPPNMYNWDSYQPMVYEYYQQNKSSPEEQIIKLEQSIEKAKAKGLNVPPGLHAQLGLLYSNTGRLDDAYAEFSKEKDLFHESGQFMDFLMKYKKTSSKNGEKQ